ncbi:MAG: L,D-transpeptidase family protein [Cyclobacteriaceae bacterium]|jgi:L,D-peptidoglycan transpeptidase YkuD (ErfK/YbiS/YcfS/YnhG family)
MRSTTMHLAGSKKILVGGIFGLSLVLSSFVLKSQSFINNIPDGCEQVILVYAEEWSGTTGELLLLEKKGQQWDTVSMAIKVNFGKNGMKWGRGLHQNNETLEKQEGDGCAPAGVFELGLAFGYDEQPTGLSWPYQQITDRDYFVDDANSRDYNTWQTIPVNEVNDPKLKWNSYEHMKRKDHLYSLGIVVKHNESPIVKGKGSAIFLHVERAPGSPTLGCTSMKAADLLKIMRWLDVDKHPLLIQAPKRELNNIEM